MKQTSTRCSLNGELNGQSAKTPMVFTQTNALRPSGKRSVES